MTAAVHGGVEKGAYLVTINLVKGHTNKKQGLGSSSGHGRAACTGKVSQPGTQLFISDMF